MSETTWHAITRHDSLAHVLALRPVPKATGIAMACKLIEAAEGRWRAVNAPHLVTLVRAGARFEYGKLVERDPVFEATQAADDTPVQPPAASNQPVNNAA